MLLKYCLSKKCQFMLLTLTSLSSDTLPKETILIHANIMLLVNVQLVLFCPSTTGESGINCFL